MVSRIASNIAKKISCRGNCTRMSASDGQMYFHPIKTCSVLQTASNQLHGENCLSTGTGYILSEVKHWNDVKCRYRAFNTNQDIDPTALNDLICCAMVQHSSSEQILLVPECQDLETTQELKQAAENFVMKYDNGSIWIKKNSEIIHFDDSKLEVICTTSCWWGEGLIIMIMQSRIK